VPADPLNIVVQTLGEARPAASNAGAAGRALNRRVAMFAQYDLRFLPGGPVFGLPRPPEPQRSPAGAALTWVQWSASWSRAASGPITDDQAKGVGEPNGGFFFVFAEFAFLCIALRIEPTPWTKVLRSFGSAQEIFMHVYRPAPVSPPPAVGAAVPACPRDAQGRPRAHCSLDRYANANFRATGASPTVGAGQSNPAYKSALAAKYTSAGLAALQLEAQINLQRAVHAVNCYEDELRRAGAR
jgi:hypothetical protein